MILKEECRQLRSDLYGCYQELVEGAPREKLLEKYVRIEVLAAQELFEKGVTLQELKAFQDRQTKRLELLAGRAISCRCGLLCVDTVELEWHIVNLADRRGHGFSAGEWR